jgi:hemerythrin-like domain-containing protein
MKEKPTEILMKEHDLIRKVLDDCSFALEKMEDGEKPPKEFFEKAVEFARTFSDKHHRFKEEFLMFTVLAQKKNGIIDAEIDALRYQHDRSRNLIAAISQSIGRYADGQDPQATIIVENMAAYISLLRRHMQREDHVFYPLVEKELSASEEQDLMDEFQKEETKTGGKAAFENAQKLEAEMGSIV